ncbi:pyridine nucleotide-disulfide oxidoreductase domain-containing protein 1 [Ischnura elegans]|uniref:pyridine nucleotide-disulfide oxidoreductase domain-containing protein 1 n=1 Tax=Ischnura elegans TaxID=197161 RepID=UPI001ED888EB|nr:pyridine nucleotide-disulfide oxidoreductase domain-containing protein 1 [Ischnura elegans]
MEPDEKEFEMGTNVPFNYMHYPIVIVGGGISGVSCLQQLALSAPEKDVIMISASSLVTTTTNVKVLTKTLTQFDVEERKIDWLQTIHPRVKVIHARVKSFDPSASRVDLSTGGPVFYSRLCICTGATPKGLPGIPGAAANPFVVGVRDAATAAELRRRVETSRRVLVTGNGGIASEVAYGLSGVQVVWVIRDHHINAAFIDPGAAAYLESNLREKKKAKAENEMDSSEVMPSESAENEKLCQPTWKIIRSNVTKESAETGDGIFGSALGPDWQNDFPLHGAVEGCESLHIEYSCEIARLLTPEEVKMEAVELFEWREKGEVTGGKDEAAKEHQISWPVYVMLTNGRCFGCDLVVAGTGVVPNSAPFLGVPGRPKSCPSDGNGLMVDIRLRTSTDRVFAAGDVVTAAWPNRSKHWLQMRLWTQARVMGYHVGRCIAVSLQREMKAIAEGKVGVDGGGQEEHKELHTDHLFESKSTVHDETSKSGDNVQLPTIVVHWKEDDYNVTIEDDENLYDFCFELFSHVTRFFGCRTILLGLFNGQGLGKEYEVVVRVGGGEYVKVIVGRDGRMAGAVLIGDTDLEETFENLILSGLDVSAYGEDLLHPGVDIEDYFD